MKLLPDTPEKVAERAKDVLGGLGSVMKHHPTGWFSDLWPKWERRLHKILEECSKRPEVAISLVGGTGSGKSTLVNALLGARILPVSNMRACTAAISEMSFSDNGAYEATITFIPRESWQREVDLLRAEVADMETPDQASTANGESETGPAISRAARDKLWAVYRPSPDADPNDLDLRNLIEPPEIAKALDQGQETLRHTDLNEFRKGLAKFLDSKHRYWPIVSSVHVSGPFEALRSGAKLIDLPGINDPNEAREEVTKEHLKTCRFVWVVFNIKRVLTRDTIALIHSEEFLRQVVMDGRANALTFVGTASDDVDPETGREEFDLDEDASDADVVLARNNEVRKEVLRQLEEQSSRLASLAHENAGHAEQLGQTLRSSNVFTISAREYLRLAGLSRSRPSGLETTEQTELPKLRDHMDTICSEYGTEAQARAHHRQINLLLAEIDRELRSLRLRLHQKTQITEKQKEDIRAAAQAAHGFLEPRLEDYHDRFVQDLAANQDLLAERLKRAIDRGRSELAACRAVLFAQLVDDPDSDPAYRRADGSVDEDAASEKRARLFDLIEELVKWQNSNNERIINAARAEIARCVASRLIEEGKLQKDTIIFGADEGKAHRKGALSGEFRTAWELIVHGHGDLKGLEHGKVRLCPPEVVNHFLATYAPPVLDPFAGGGSIPLEAQRLGLRAYASDLNPVAVLINKALIEIPPKFADMPPVNPEAQKKLKTATYRGAQVSRYPQRSA